MQRHGQGDREPLGGEPPDRRDQADRGDGDRPLGDAEPVGHRVGEPAQRGDHLRVVRERLAHAHEHHVGDAAGPAGNLAPGERPCAGHHLRDDLGSRQVPGQPRLAGGAERAGHPAAGLRRHAHGDAPRVAHEDRLHVGAVERTPQGLAGHPSVAGLLALGGEQPRQQRGGEPGAGSRRQIGHLVRVVGQPGEIVTGELVAAEGLAAQLGNGRPARGGVKVGEVARRPGPGDGQTMLRSVV